MAKGTVWALAALGISIVLLAQDFSALNVALPSIERGLDTDLSTAQWVINAYALVFAMLIVTGGRLADQFGRRRVFLIGAATFAAMSLVAGLAPNASVLIGARGLMGIGGALMWPAILGMAYAILPADRAGLAGGLILGAAGVGQAVGPIVGGALTEFFGWRWVQLANVPVAALAMLVVWRTIAAPGAVGGGGKVDAAGIVTLAVGLVALLFALDQAADWGWGDPRILLGLGLAIAAIAAFVAVERRAGAAALVPGDVMRNRPFVVACALIALISPAFVAVLLYLPQFLQKLLGASPLTAGTAMLPMLGGFAVVSFVAGSLYERLGAKLVVTAGAAGIAVGTFLLAGVGADAGVGTLVPGMVVAGIGLGLFYSSVTTAGVTAVDPSRTSLAGGLVYMFQLAGGAIGLGLTTTIFAAASDAALRAETAALGAAAAPAAIVALRGVLAGTESAQQALAPFGPEAAARLIDASRDAFAAGFGAGLRLDAALALAAAVLAALLLAGKRQPTAAARPEAVPTQGG